LGLRRFRGSSCFSTHRRASGAPDATVRLFQMASCLRRNERMAGRARRGRLCRLAQGRLAACGGGIGVLGHVARPKGQNLRRHVRVAFPNRVGTAKTDEAHPEGCGDAGHTHREQAQQRRQQRLAERGDTTPMCDCSCVCHGRYCPPLDNPAGYLFPGAQWASAFRDTLRREIRRPVLGRRKPAPAKKGCRVILGRWRRLTRELERARPDAGIFQHNCIRLARSFTGPIDASIAPTCRLTTRLRPGLSCV
jgi:hypothetical protein